VATKVSELVIMGGEYPLGHEYNFAGYNATATAEVVSTWPGRVTFSGFEMGREVYSGARLMVEGPPNDPVNAAYRWYKSVARSLYVSLRLSQPQETRHSLIEILPAVTMSPGSHGIHSQCSTPPKG
jgi:hypothetical protein